MLGGANDLMLLEYAGERMLWRGCCRAQRLQGDEIAAELMAKLYAASEEPLPLPFLPIRYLLCQLCLRQHDDQNAGCQTDYVHAAELSLPIK